MPTMSRFESAWCRSAPWRTFAQKVVLPWALQGSEPKGHVLEIGGGSGAMAEQLLLGHPDLRLTVTDFDPEMVRAARDRLSRFGDRVTLEEADATKLQFDDGTFDAVVSFIMLHHVVRWEQAFREALRVTRPGGRVIGYDLLASTPLKMLRRSDRSDERLIELDELRALIAELPVERARVLPSVGALATRFALTKAA